MLFGRLLRAEISRSGSASPVERNAESSCAACMTDFTRYRSDGPVRAPSMTAHYRPAFHNAQQFSAMQNDELVLLRLSHLLKSFPGVRALRGVSFELRRGEVHAIVGENGAGKSTLIKAITGAVTPDAGEIAIDGRPLAWMDPHAAAAAG